MRCEILKLTKDIKPSANQYTKYYKRIIKKKTKNTKQSFVDVFLRAIVSYSVQTDAVLLVHGRINKRLIQCCCFFSFNLDCQSYTDPFIFCLGYACLIISVMFSAITSTLHINGFIHKTINGFIHIIRFFPHVCATYLIWLSYLPNLRNDCSS